MKTTMYKRGKYNKQHPKEKKITFLSDELMLINLKQLSIKQGKSLSQIIREAIQENYIKSLPVKK